LTPSGIGWHRQAKLSVKEPRKLAGSTPAQYTMKQITVTREFFAVFCWCILSFCWIYLGTRILTKSRLIDYLNFLLFPIVVFFIMWLLVGDY
jgi:hypothetical protein